MKSLEIKGKPYIQVNERIKEFRTNDKYDGYCLASNIVKWENDTIIIKAVITDKEGNVVATGLAEESKGSTFINKTSYIENCETSAWGRALGNLGIGIDASIASADEVFNAINNQKETLDHLHPKFSEAVKFVLDGGDIGKVKSRYELTEDFENAINNTVS